MPDGESVLLNLLVITDLFLQLCCTTNNHIYLPSDDMLLVNTFEETFGDTYPEGDWHEFSKKGSSNIDRYVVALASFSGELQ